MREGINRMNTYLSYFAASIKTESCEYIIKNLLQILKVCYLYLS